MNPDCGVDASCSGETGGVICPATGGCPTYTNVSTQTGYVRFNLVASRNDIFWFPNGTPTSGASGFTNADHGSLLTYFVHLPQYRSYRNWHNFSNDTFVAESKQSAFATLATGGALSVSRTPGQSALIPFLQLDDGTFVGRTYANGASSMLRFDATGRVFWSKTGYLSPQLATTDGGFLASSDNPQYGRTAALKFDRYGNFIQSITEFPIQSWTGNMYRLGSTDWLPNAPYDLLATFAAWPGGNQSNGTAFMSSAYLQAQSDCAGNPQFGSLGDRDIAWQLHGVGSKQFYVWEHIGGNPSWAPSGPQPGMSGGLINSFHDTQRPLAPFGTGTQYFTYGTDSTGLNGPAWPIFDLRLSTGKRIRWVLKLDHFQGNLGAPGWVTVNDKLAPSLAPCSLWGGPF